jgi:hypothetical protein
VVGGGLVVTWWCVGDRGRTKEAGTERLGRTWARERAGRMNRSDDGRGHGREGGLDEVKRVQLGARVVNTEARLFGHS